MKVKIEKEKCVGCGLCKKDCPGRVIEINNQKAEIARDGLCIECGHCFAVCPNDAVEMTNFDTSDCGKFVPMTEFDSEKLLSAMKGRRTIRQFKDKPIEREKIDMLIEAGRCCQTAANGRSVAFTILGSKRAAIEKECVKLFKTGINLGSNFVKSLKGYEVDDNFFFKGAPLVIVVSGKNGADRGLAVSYIELLAESMGLGVLISGFTEICARLNPKIRSMLSLPKGHKIHAVMIIGYPDVKYSRIAPRKPANVKVL